MKRPRNALLQLQLALAIVLLSSGNLVLSSDQIIRLGDSIELQSDLFNEPREVWVSTPDNYHLSTQDYPVLYLLDARWHFHHTVGLVDFLAGIGATPPMIVVGIVSENRSLDLTPVLESQTAERRFGDNKGGADTLLRFIKTELNHYLQQHYRVAEYKLFFGHSLGGLTVLESLKSDPTFFAIHHAMAPSGQYLNDTDWESLLKATADVAESDTLLLISIGGKEQDLNNILESNWLSKLRENPAHGLRWQKLRVEGETHSSMVHKATYAALLAAFEPLQLETLQRVFSQNGYSGLKDHINKVNDIYPFPTNPLINPKVRELTLAIYLTQGEEVSTALFENFARDFPSHMDASMWEFWAQGYQNLGQDAVARNKMETVLQMNPGSEVARNYFSNIEQDVVEITPPSSLTPEALQKYTGRYQLAANDSVEVFIRNQQLWVKTSLPVREQLHWVGDNQFYVRGPSAIRYQFSNENEEGFNELIRESTQGTVRANRVNGF